VTKAITTHSELETAALGLELAGTLSAGDVVLLVGDLGAGKTAFVRGLAEGLGVHRDEVSSPTFTLVQEYRGGRLPLFHVDLYRLNDPREVDDLGLDEIADDGVLAIEWAEKLTGNARLKPSRYEDAIVVRIEHSGPDARNLTIRLPDHPITRLPDSTHSDR
jgi:tRNA threonylcarbamoyladenosine biosynthesis protein TsaE